MAIYTGSPLGLVSDFYQSGQNTAYSQYSDTLSIGGEDVSATVSDSLFSSGHRFIKKRVSDSDLAIDPLSFGSPSIIHESDVYDISTTNIINILGDYNTMRLKTSDFVYCRNYGVFPNNRLVVCRRFPNTIGDDLTQKDLVSPNVSLVSWFSDQENPISFEFGEQWVSSDTSLKNALNDIGKDIVTENAGDRAGRLLDGIPLPGMTELLQREILQNLGIISKDASVLPSGDPNLILESKRRALVSIENGGSGLKGKFRVKVKCSWEQKFISGVDPTFVYYDILRTILEFGGSEATFYLGKNGLISDQKNLQKGLVRIQKEPLKFVTDYINAIIKSMSEFSEKIVQYLSGETVEDETSKLSVGDIEKVKVGLASALESLPATIAKKYKVPLLGIVSSLTGAPSGFWHVTVGNPMRPILCSGDMICEEVSVSLGPSLSFNDLPSTIECEFTLESARNLGIDEIFSKLSSGYLRVIEIGDESYRTSSTKSPNSFTNSDVDIVGDENFVKGRYNKDREEQAQFQRDLVESRGISQPGETTDQSEVSQNNMDSNQGKTIVGNAFSSESGDYIIPDPHNTSGYSNTLDQRIDQYVEFGNNII